MHKSKNIVHINTKAKRSQTSCLQEVWPFYSLTSVKDGIIANLRTIINNKKDKKEVEKKCHVSYTINNI